MMRPLAGDAISCWCWLPVAAELCRVSQGQSVMSGARSRLSHDKPGPAQHRQSGPDTIFKGCSMLIVPGTQQPTQQCGETACKNAGSQIIPLFKS